jgi:hypothetical protein
MVRAGVPERVAMEISGRRTRSIFEPSKIVSERDKESPNPEQVYLSSESKKRKVAVMRKMASR